MSEQNETTPNEAAPNEPASYAESKTLADVHRAKAARLLDYGDLLAGRPEAQPINIGHYMAASAEVAQFIPLKARVWVPGLRDPETQKMGVVATVCKPTPDQEIAIYAKSREKAMPEEAKQYLNVDHLPARGRAYRFECIWKLVYCCEAPLVTFDWACKIMSLPYGAQVLKPLIDRIDELTGITQPIDDLTDNNLFAYPTLFGDAKIAARDGKLSEYFGSLEKGVAQAIRDNARTMWLIQIEVLREDAELRAVIARVINDEIEKGAYEASPAIKEALAAPVPGAQANEAIRAANQAPRASR